MPGLNLSSGIRASLGGQRTGPAPQFGTASSYGAPVSVTSAAFGPGVTGPTPTTADTLAPNDGFGVAFTAGVLAIAALCFIRYTLPR